MGLLMLVTVVTADILDVLEADYKFAARTSTDNVISITDLMYIYTGNIKYWGDGTKIVVFVRPKNDVVQNDMIVELFAVSPTSFFEAVERNRKVIVVDCLDMSSMIELTKGSIGMINKEDIAINTGLDVKILKIVQ